MSVPTQSRGMRALALAALTLAVALASILLASAAASGSASPAASAAKKKCGAGKQLVRRPGRSSVCAKKCPSGTKRKVSSKGRVSCVKRKSGTVDGGPAPAPEGSTGSGPAPAPADSGPAAGDYSGQTEQERPVKFTVEGGEVRGFEAGVNTWCNTMYNNRVNFDAIANVPPMAIGSDGSFHYRGDENNGNIEIDGVVTGSSATGTVGMNRGDTNYQDGRMWFGSCQAHDVKWSAAKG